FGTGTEGMFRVIEHVDVHSGLAFPAVDQRSDGTLPFATQVQGAVRGLQLEAQTLLTVVTKLEATNAIAVYRLEVMLLKQGTDLFRAYFAAACLGLCLDPTAEVDLQPAWQLQAKV